MKTDSGFTLIELLAAMLAGSMLLVGLGWSLSGLRDQLSRSNLSERAREDRLSLAAVTGFIEDSDLSPADLADLVAQPDRLQLKITAPRAIEAASAVLLDLRVEPFEGAPALVAHVASLPGAQPLATGNAPQLILARLRSARFSYRQGPESARPPEAAVLDYVDAAGRAHQARIRLRPQIAGACQYDAIAQGCRP